MDATRHVVPSIWEPWAVVREDLLSGLNLEFGLVASLEHYYELHVETPRMFVRSMWFSAECMGLYRGGLLYFSGLSSRLLCCA